MSRLVFAADDLAGRLGAAIGQKVKHVTITSTKGAAKRPSGAVEIRFADGDVVRVRAAGCRIDPVEEAYSHKVTPRTLLRGFGGRLTDRGSVALKVFMMGVELSPYGVKVDKPVDIVTETLRRLAKERRGR